MIIRFFITRVCLWLILCLSSVVSSIGEVSGDTNLHTGGGELARDIEIALSDRIEEGGSFYAEYHLYLPEDTSFNMTVLYDVVQNYALLSATMLNGGPPLAVFKFEISTSKEQETGELMIIQGGEGNHWRISPSFLNDQALRPDAPLGLLLLIVDSMISQQEKDYDLSAYQENISNTGKLVPAIKLGFSSDREIRAGVGYHYSVAGNVGLKVSWIDEGLYGKATEIEQEQDKVKLTFPDGRNLEVDSSNGILIRDVSDSPKKAVIERQRLSVFGHETVPSELVPSFDSVVLQEGNPDGFLESMIFDVSLQILEAFTKEMGDRGRFEITDGEEFLVQQTIRKRAREQSRGLSKHLLSEEEMGEFVNSSVLSNYDLFITEFKGDNAERWGAFIESIQDQIKKQEKTFEVPFIERKAESLQENAMALIQGLPLTVQDYWKEIYKIGMLSYIDGWREGALLDLLDRIKKEVKDDARAIEK